MSIKEYQNELNNLYIELEKVERMSELEACDFCNADSKQDALEAIQEEIDYWENQVRELEDEESDEMSECSGYHLDPAFNSWYEVNSMFV